MRNFSVGSKEIGWQRSRGFLAGPSCLKKQMTVRLSNISLSVRKKTSWENR